MLLALAVRLWGVADRLPDPTLGIDPMSGDTAVDEGDRRAMTVAWEMWRGGTQGLDLNPKTGDWPGLPFYVTLGTQVLYRAYFSIAHGGVTAADFARHVESDPAELFLFARLFNVLVGVLTVYLIYRLGSILAGRRLGLIAALLLALNPFHILTSQRVVDPNLLALAFVLIATTQLVGANGSRPAAIAGAMIGLAGACKYVPLALAAVLAVGQIEPSGRGSRVPLRVRWRHIAVGFSAALLAFSLASPYTLLDWTTKAQDLQLQRGRLLGEWVGITEATVSLPTYFVRTLPHMLGWPAYLLAIVGGVLLFMHRPRGWIVMLVPVVLLIPTGLLAMAQERFMVPALGSLVAAAAYAVVRSASWWRERSAPSAVGRTATAVALLLPIAVSIVWTAPEYLRTRNALRLADTRHLARRWIEHSIPRSVPIAIDLYGPEFDPEKDGRIALVWPFLATQAPYVRAAYHPQWLDGLRYYVTSGEVVRRFEAAADRYPDEASFHRWIQSHGTLIWTADSETASGPKICVWGLPAEISNREGRDRLWSEALGRPMYASRLARWCRDMTSAFLRMEQLDRAEEWAARGLTIRGRFFRKDLLETLSLAQVRLGRPSEGVQTARDGLREFPESPMLHLNCAMSLAALSRRDEAITEYHAALRLSPNPQAAQLIRDQLAILEGGRLRP